MTLGSKWQEGVRGKPGLLLCRTLIRHAAPKQLRKRLPCLHSVLSSWEFRTRESGILSPRAGPKVSQSLYYGPMSMQIPKTLQEKNVAMDRNHSSYPSCEICPFSTTQIIFSFESPFSSRKLIWVNSRSLIFHLVGVCTEFRTGPPSTIAHRKGGESILRDISSCTGMHPYILVLSGLRSASHPVTAVFSSQNRTFPGLQAFLSCAHSSQLQAAHSDCWLLCAAAFHNLDTPFWGCSPETTFLPPSPPLLLSSLLEHT